MSSSQPQKEVSPIKNFFKVMIDGFERELRLPSHFCWGLNVEEVGDKAILKSCKGSWMVEIGKYRNGLLSIHGDGWNSFISSHDLNLGDFVTFKLTGSMEFKTRCYNRSACEKQFLGPNDNMRSNKKGKRVRVKRGPCSAHHFEAKIQSHNLKFKYLTIPSRFLHFNDLTKKRSVTLQTDSHKCQVELRVKNDKRETRAHDKHVVMHNDGWLEFCKSNKLKEGDTCVFKLDQSSSSSTLPSPTTVVMNVTIISK